MSADTTQDNVVGDELILFIAGDAPRSRRARTNLATALERADRSAVQLREVDVLHEPVAAIDHGIFATPALVRPHSSGTPIVLYGDLSDNDALNRFIALLPA